MDRLCVKAAGCNYKEQHREFKEQFINAIDDEELLQEIIKELMAWRNTRETDSEQVLMWVQRG